MRSYYALATFKLSGLQTFASFVVETEQAVDSKSTLEQLKSNVARIASCETEGMEIWAYWPLDKAPQTGVYSYKISFLILGGGVPQMYTDTYTIPIPLDSPEGMNALLSHLPGYAPFFITPLKPEATAMTFERFLPSNN